VARLPRLALAGHVHLVVQRAQESAALVTDDADRRHFLDVLREVMATQRVAVHAYVLMGSHFLLLLTPQSAEGLSLAMQALGRRYVAAFNLRHRRAGTLWQGRFRATVLEAERWLLDAMKYVELEPVRGGEVARAEGWRWSSAPHHLGLARDPLVTDHRRYWALGNTPFEREAAYRALLDDGLSAARTQAIADAAHKGWAIGSPAFLAELATLTHRPLAARKRGRPRKGGPDVSPINKG